MIALDGLAPVDALALAAILAKAAGYGAALLAMGGPLFLVAFPEAEESVRRLARRVAVAAALVLVAVLALRFGIRAMRISGMGLAGATDPMMLGLIWDSPLGTAAIWRGAGAVLVLGLMLSGRAGLLAGLAGAGAIAVSFSLVGHSLGEPRLVLGVLVASHVLAVAFWVGALLPLRRAATTPDGARLLHRFGVLASVAVAVLAVAGVAFAWHVSGSLAAFLGAAWSWILIAKLAGVGGLLALAALNRWRLVPALAAGKPGTAATLRRSISIEIALVALVLLATATLTTVTTPPDRMLP